MGKGEIGNEEENGDNGEEDRVFGRQSKERRRRREGATKGGGEGGGSKGTGEVTRKLRDMEVKLDKREREERKNN